MCIYIYIYIYQPARLHGGCIAYHIISYHSAVCRYVVPCYVAALHGGELALADAEREDGADASLPDHGDHILAADNCSTNNCNGTNNTNIHYL